MGKVPVRLKEVVYTISPFETTVMSGLFKNLPQKVHEKFKQVQPLVTFFSSAGMQIDITQIIISMKFAC